MNPQLKEVYDTYKNHSDSERIQAARNAAGYLVSYEKGLGKEDKDVLVFLLQIVRLFVSADRTCSEEEAKLFNDITGWTISYDEFFDFTNGGASSDFVSYMDAEIDAMEEEAKLAVCVLGLTFLASDGEIEPSEMALFEKILA